MNVITSIIYYSMKVHLLSLLALQAVVTLLVVHLKKHNSVATVHIYKMIEKNDKVKKSLRPIANYIIENNIYL